MSAPRRRRSTIAGSLIACLAAIAAPAPALAAGGQDLLGVDPFAGATTSAAVIALRNAPAAGLPCLTAGTDT